MLMVRLESLQGHAHERADRLQHVAAFLDQDGRETEPA